MFNELFSPIRKINWRGKSMGYPLRKLAYKPEEAMRPVVLVVDDEEHIREALQILLKEKYDVILAGDAYEALSVARSRHLDMALMDVNLPGMDGLKALDAIKEINREIGVVMLSASDSAQQAVAALRKGAYDYITKPFSDDELITVLDRYTDTLALKSEVNYLKEVLQTQSYGEIISNSPKMKAIFDLIQKVSQTSSSVLITGESGTGKELVARAIHARSARSDKPLVTVNCGAVPSELMESELFGHERGSFTGAFARKIGKFEYADGGTLFLDEIATIPMHLQVKLLRVLQEKTFERVGSNASIKVDIRVIAATNVDLVKEVRNGNFREDLYYRLKVVPIELPPLRERKEDIELLAAHFLDKHSKKCNKSVAGISKEALKALADYSWPGNVRELENLVERLVVLAREGGEIMYGDIPFGILEHAQEISGEAGDFREACRSFERHYIISVLNNTNWNRIEAARRMKIHRNTLLMKMKDLGIKEPGGSRYN